MKETGYSTVPLNKRNYKSHRIIYAIHYKNNNISNYIVDHIDGNPLNNDPANLRLTDLYGNSHNSKIRNDNKSGFKGVVWCNHRKRWRVCMIYKGNRMYLGQYKILEDAAKAYEEASIKYHGKFRRED